MNKLIVFLLISIIYNSSKAFCQEDYVDGFIITNDNDTIYGKLKDKFPMRLAYSVDIVKLKVGDDIKTYKPEDLKQYKKKGSLGYMSLISGSVQYFTKIIIEGKVRLTCMELAPGGNNVMTLKDDNYGKREIYTSNRIVYHLYNKEQDKLYSLKKTKFKKVINECFFDSDEILSKVENKEYKYSDIREIVKKYNATN